MSNNYVRTEASASTLYPTTTPSPESNASGVNWSSIFGGAVGAAAVSMILMILGAALGLSAMAPWSSSTATSFTMKAAMWLIFTQWIASGLGGYITGRLRVKWVSIHDDEMFFRDTAHGFLTWAIATLLTVGILASGTSAMMGLGARSASTLAAGAMQASAQPGPARMTANMPDPWAYTIDALYRPVNVEGSAITPETPNAATPGTPPVTQEQRAEITRILMQDLKDGNVPDADKTYMAQVVASRTGLSEQDASKRVDDTFTKLNAIKDQAKQDAEQARKTTMHVSLFIAFSMMIGAFIASVAATLGGRLRDEYHAEYHSGVAKL